MTSWRIEPGYPSLPSKAETWQAIKNAVEKTFASSIIDEYYICLPDKLRTTNARKDAQNIATAMAKKEDLSVGIYEDEQVVRLLASGGEYREIKERMRRAFIRCVLRIAADFNIDVTSH